MLKNVTQHVWFSDQTRFLQKHLQPIYLYSTARVELDNASPSGLGVFSPTTRIKPANLSISYSELNDKYLHIKIKLITLTHALAFI